MNGTSDSEDELAGPTLYLESERLDPTEAFCTEIFEDAEEEEYRVVQLTTKRSFDSMHDAFDVQLEEINDPSEAAVIILSPNSENDSTISMGSEDVPLYGFWVDPHDLTGITIAFSNLIERWEDEPGETRICLRNVESLLPYHDSNLIYRFLNTVLATLQGAGADVHAHLRPAATEDRELDLLSSLFSHVIEPTEASLSRPVTAEKRSSPSESVSPDESDTERTVGSQETKTTTMSEEEIDAFLESTGHGVLAFSGSPPYAVPMSYGYDSDAQRMYFQLGVFEGSQKQERLADSRDVSLVVSRYTRPDHWRSVIVDGAITPLSESRIDEATVLDAYAESDLASIDVFVKDLSTVSFDWYILEPTAVSGRQSSSYP